METPVVEAGGGNKEGSARAIGSSGKWTVEEPGDGVKGERLLLSWRVALVVVKGELG